MAIQFPSNPTLNQSYTYNSRTWTWSGTKWVLELAQELQVDWAETDNTQLDFIKNKPDLSNISPSVIISTVEVTNSSYVVQTDQAVSTGGGYIKVTGSGFINNCNIYIDSGSTNASVLATTTTFISNTELRAQLPATAAGSYTLYVVNPNSTVGIKINGVTFTLPPVWITTSSLPVLAITVAASVQLQASTTYGTVSYSLDTGSQLPTGLSLSTSGLISGTPTTAGTYSFIILASNPYNQKTPQTFSITLVQGQVIVSPAISGITYWNFPVHGPININSASIYTITPLVNQTWTVKLWGAGGGGTNNSVSTGGGGGYSTGTLAVTQNTNYILVCGERGQQQSGSNTLNTQGIGGGGRTSGTSGSGGGYSGIFEGTETQANSIIIAGGGGGAGQAGGVNTSGGAGGGTSGLAGATYQFAAGTGGTQSAGGTGFQAGTALKGGDSYANASAAGGAGGGGYWGGGSSQGSSNVSSSGGGGGSGYIHPTKLTSASTTAGSGRTPGNSSDSDCAEAGFGSPATGTVGGGNASTTHGRLIIRKN